MTTKGRKIVVNTGGVQWSAELYRYQWDDKGWYCCRIVDNSYLQTDGKWGNKLAFWQTRESLIAFIKQLNAKAASLPSWQVLAEQMIKDVAMSCTHGAKRPCKYSSKLTPAQQGRLQKVASMVEASGGKLRSRQVIAAILVGN